MEVGRRKNSLDNTTSDCRNSGGILRPSSQSRKMSIGIMIDALENKRSRDTKTGNVIESNTKKANSNEGDSVNGRTKRKVVGTDERKETEAPEQVTSPWINTGSFHQKTKASPTTSMRKISTTFANLLSADGGKQQKFDGITYKRMGSRVTNLQKREECKLGDSRKKDKDAVDANEETHSEAPEKVTSSLIGTRSFHNKIPLPTTSVKRNKPGRAQHAAITHSEQSFATHLHAAGSKQQKFDEVTDKRMGGTVGNSQDSEECTIVSANEVLASNKAVTEGKKEGERTETLKKKLQEIFGTHTSSPKSSQGLGHSNLKLKQIHHQRDNSAANPIQNSDTIETDSENPDCKIMRPVTCSLTRIRVATKVRPAKTKTGPSSSVEHKFHEKNVFSSEEGLFEKRDVGNGGCLMSARKNGSEKNSGIKPRKIYFSKNNIENEVQGVTCRREMPPPVQKASSLRDKSRSSHGGSPQGEDKRPKLRNASLKGGSHQSARENMVDQPADSISPFVPMNGHQQEKFGSQGKKNVTVMQEESLSPTFKPNTPTSSSSPSSTPKSHPAEFRVYSPVATEKEFTPRNIYSWKNLQTSKDNAEALEDSPLCKQDPFKGRKEEPEGLSESSSEDGDSKNSDEECNDRYGSSPEIAMAERPNFMGYLAKKLRNREGNGVSHFSPTLPSPKGVDENDWTLEPSEQTQGNDLERIVTLFALALEDFRNKMKSATRRKSSEILMSVSEEIHLQLQNVQSQIQTEVGKLIKIGNSKRKRLETRFEEQQDKLKLIYDKFKEDIHHHLQECKSTVDEFEMHHIELKATMKKQKASHEKLANEVEEAIETQLNNADRRITAVNKSAKGKMLRLQQIIFECLKEGTL